jgi:hypothetical protein
MNLSNLAMMQLSAYPAGTKLAEQKALNPAAPYLPINISGSMSSASPTTNSPSSLTTPLTRKYTRLRFVP